MRIILAYADATSRQLLVDAIQVGTDHDVVVVDNDRQLLEYATGQPPPGAFLLDAAFPGLSAFEACRQIRACSGRLQPYILAVTTREAPGSVSQWLRAGADDALAGPPPPDIVLARLGSAALRRQPREDAQAAFTSALRAAALEGNGELVVRGGTKTARIYFHDGRVAWIHVSGEPVSLANLLPADSGVDDATAQTLIDECRARRTRLSETLVRWGLVDRTRLESSLRRWLGEQLAAIRRFEAPVSLFLPQALSYADDLLFSVSELLGDANAAPEESGAAPAPSSIVDSGADRTWDAAFLRPAEPPAGPRRLLAACSELEGACGVAVLDRRTGLCLGQWGDHLNPDLAWSFISVTGRGRASDVVTTTDRHYHLMRALPAAPDWTVYVVMDCARVRLAKAQVELRLLLERRDSDGATQLL